jgi:hypothetical protein
MGEFNWDGETYTKTDSGDFISEEAFNKLVYTDAIVFVTGFRKGESNFDKKKGPQEQHLVDFMTDDGEEFTKGLGVGNDERDARFARLAATIEASGEPLEASWVKVGKRFDLGPPKKG